MGKAALSYAFGPGGVSFAAPQLVLTAAYLAVYGLGLFFVGTGNLRHPDLVLPAVVLGGLGIVVGSVAGWARFGGSHLGGARATEAVRHSPWVSVLGCVLAALGLVSLGLYFARLGDIPLLMQNAEQARVDAALRGGAPLRVAGLLTLPGSWLLVAHGAATGRKTWAAVATVVALLTASLWLATASRAPAILTMEVSLLVALYVRRRERVGARGLALLAAAALTAVLVAAIVGGLRLASSGSSAESGQRAAASDPARLVALAAIAIEGYVRVPIQNLEYTIDAVPDRIPWRFGYTYLQPLLTALPGRQTTFDQDLKDALGQTFRGGGTVPGLLGESYANFGPAGWPLVPGVLAFALQWLFSLTRRVDTSVSWTLYACALALALGGFVSGISVASPFPILALSVLGAATLRSRRWRPD